MVFPLENFWSSAFQIPLCLIGWLAVAILCTGISSTSLGTSLVPIFSYSEASIIFMYADLIAKPTGSFLLSVMKISI